MLDVKLFETASKTVKVENRCSETKNNEASVTSRGEQLQIICVLFSKTT